MNNDSAFWFVIGLSVNLIAYGAGWIVGKVYRKIRERYRLSPGVEMLIESGVISRRPESRTVDSTFLSHIARLIDGSEFPEDVRRNMSEVHFKGGPFDGSLGLYPTFCKIQEYFLLPVHRRHNRFAVYRRVSVSEDWSGEQVTKIFDMQFGCFASKPEADEILRKMILEGIRSNE
ncbi:MAG: hypothetical protein KDA68_14245 [Planctomycetaceae bacterium]|nr:hypothetical protein [Planctomycetaceae bacterium]